MTDFVLRGGTVVFPDKAPALHDILVQKGKIAALLAPGARRPPASPEAERSRDGTSSPA